jgi:hypothetical protein
VSLVFLTEVVQATAHVLQIESSALTAETLFESIEADSVARIAIADAVEVFHPELVVSNDVLLFATTLGELAGGVAYRNERRDV